MTQTYRLGLWGHQIQYSLSPKIHSYWFSLYKINAEYCLYDIPHSHEKEGFEKLLNTGIDGLNITIPYKEVVFQRFGQPTARLTAVNTLARQSNGIYQATNSDVLAALDVFKNCDPRQKIVILGNGGTARALVEAFYLLKMKQVHLVQRQQKHWHSDYTPLLHFHDWNNAYSLMNEASIIINTVPHLNVDVPPLCTKTVVCDYTYGELPSVIVQQAHQSGCLIIPGVEFLLRQAQHSFKSWFSIFPEITNELRMLISK
jgi:shikimate dehydrogenase